MSPPPPPPWADWTTGSLFRIRVAPAAAEELRRLSEATQHRLRSVLHDIAELAELAPSGSTHGWSPSRSVPLQFSVDGTVVRYSVNEDARTLYVERVGAHDDDSGEYERAG